MAQNINAIKGDIRAKGEDVLVVDMWFGEQTTASGLIISSDDGDTRGIYPRWGRVYSKGPRNKDPFKEGDWILVSHGRWTRGLKFETGGDLKKFEEHSTGFFSELKDTFVYKETNFSGIFVYNYDSEITSTELTVN